MLLVYVYKCRFALCLFVHTLEFIRLNLLASEHKDPPISDCLALAFRYLPSQLLWRKRNLITFRLASPLAMVLSP